MVKRSFKTLVLTFSLFLMFTAFATVEARNLKLAVGLALPPYFIPDSKSGMEFEIIKEALRVSKHDVIPVFLPLARVKSVMAEGKVDCASPINNNSGVEAYYSDSHISYQNAAISLAKNKLQINTIADLSGKSVIGFQDATNYLGSEYKTMAANNSRYREKYDQKMQNIYLFNDRIQVIVMDINIFKYFKKRVSSFSNTAQPVVFHELFPKTDYNVAFREKGLRDAFNKGLKQIRADNRYHNIIKKYIQ